jgi:chemosensory pili system protein ChpA (sensor histidine kinase/response regulator)
MALLRRNHTAHPDSLEAIACVQQAIAALTLMLSDVVRQHEPEAAPTLVEMLDTLYPELVVEKPEALEATSEPQSVAAGKGTAAAAPGASPTSTAVEAPQLHDELDEQLLPLFLEEALDLNQNIATQLHAWRSNPSDGEAVRRLARLFHTLKGSARMAGAMNLGELTHAIETRMQEAQEASSAPLQLIDDIDNAFDVIVQIVERLQHGELCRRPGRDIRRGGIGTGRRTRRRPAGPGFRTGCCGSAGPQEVDSEAAAQRATLRVRADLIDRLVNEAGELSIARSRIEGEMRAIKGSLLDLTENVIRLRRQLRDIEIQAELQMQSRAQSAERTPILIRWNSTASRVSRN